MATAVLLAAIGVAVLQIGCGSGGGGGGSTTTPPASGAAVSLSPASVSFGSQAVGTTSLPQTVTLTNSGSAALAVSAIAAAGDFLQSNTCGASLAAGGTCAITVRFAPTAAGTRSGAISIADNAAGSPHTISLGGTGVSAAAGTPAGTYSITVAGTAGTLLQSTTVSLVVR